MFKRLVVFCDFLLFDAGSFYIAQSGSEFSVFLQVGTEPTSTELGEASGLLTDGHCKRRPSSNSG